MDDELLIVILIKGTVMPFLSLACLLGIVHRPLPSVSHSQTPARIYLSISRTANSLLFSSWIGLSGPWTPLCILGRRNTLVAAAHSVGCLLLVHARMHTQ